MQCARTLIYIPYMKMAHYRYFNQSQTAFHYSLFSFTQRRTFDLKKLNEAKYWENQLLLSKLQLTLLFFWSFFWKELIRKIEIFAIFVSILSFFDSFSPVQSVNFSSFLCNIKYGAYFLLSCHKLSPFHRLLPLERDILYVRSHNSHAVFLA